MPTCADSETLIKNLMSTGLTREERKRLVEHAETCARCRELLAVHESLEQVEMPEAAEAELARVRQAVLRTLRGEAAAGLEEGERGWLQALLLRPALAATAALVILVAGIGVGRLTDVRAGAAAGLDPAAVFADQIEHLAASNRQLEQSRRSTLRFANVRLDEVGDDRVRMSFDVATRLELVRAHDDPLVAEVLVQSLLAPEPLRTRLQAVAMIAPLEPKVRDALIVSMLDDPELAVRLKALEKLTANGAEAATQAALLEVLKREDSVQMRLLAIEHLTANRVAPDLLRQALAEGRPEPGTAVYAKADEYLRVF